MMKQSCNINAIDVQSIRITSERNEAMKWLVSKDFRRHSTAAANESKPTIQLPYDLKPSRYERRLRRWKRNARSELETKGNAGWQRGNYRNLNFCIPDYVDQVERINSDEVSLVEFAERFEAPGKVCVITGATREWPAETEWTPQQLVNRFHNEKFKVGEDDDGKSVFLPFSYFMHYCITSGDAEKDDSPLYIFDPNFGDRSRTNTADDIKRKKKSESKNTESSETIADRTTPASPEKEKDNILKREIHTVDGTPAVSSDRKRLKLDIQEKLEPPLKLTFQRRATTASTTAAPISPIDSANDISQPSSTLIESRATKEMLQDYVIPKYFRDDLFQYTGSKRPPHRWVVIGPKRSGTGIHVDPLGTSAWNTLLSGHKRWALFPPHTPKNLVSMRGLPDHEAATWFVMVYPRLRDPSTIDSSGLTLAERLGIVDLIQRPGETVFVPGGWWHLVINLDFTVGVTQNFCSVANFGQVWLKTRHSRPKMAEKLLGKLRGFVEHPREEDDDDRESNTGRKKAEVFKGLLETVKRLETVPQVRPSTTDSSASSSSSSSGSSETEGASRDGTASESSDEDGRCLCRKCKLRRKRRNGTLGISSTLLTRDGRRK